MKSGITMVILRRMKTAISIPDSEFEAAEELAKRLGMSRSELYRTALAAFLSQHAEDGVTEKLNEIYGPDGTASALPRDLRRMQADSLAGEKW